MATAFEIVRPEESDADRIAEIHLAAMDSNPLLHAQFPTAQSLEALQEYLRAYTVGEIRDLRAGVLIARDPTTGRVVSFAKWDMPTASQSDSDHVKLEAGDLKNSPGCCQEYLEEYARLAEETKKKVWGERPCYQLTFVCTDPKYQGQGAGVQLTREVMRRAEGDDGLPMYLESTAVALPMYEKLGFRVLARFGMAIPHPTMPEVKIEYSESCMVWHPVQNSRYLSV